MAALCPPVKFQAFDNLGDPAIGYKLYTYDSGTTTNKATYTDAAGAVPNANPVIFDARGEVTLFLTPGEPYRIVLKTDLDVTVWTQDGVSAALNNTAGDGISISAGGVISLPSSVAGAGLTLTAGVLAVVAGNTSITVSANSLVLNVGNANTWTALQTNSVGINVGNAAQAAVTTLDWYEEGTFTPTSKGATSAGAGTYTAQEGTYTRIGNRVFFHINIGWSAHTGTGALQITSLPFNGDGSHTHPVSVRYNSLVVTAGMQLCAAVSGANILLLAADPSGGVEAAVAMDTAVTLLQISGQYKV